MSVKKIPLRQCIGCGEMKNKKEMVRILKTAEGEIVLDATGKKNGRGAYICPSMDCFRKAKKSRGLDRSFKMAVPAEIPAKMAEAIPAVTAAEVLKAEATPAAAVLPPNQKIDSDKSGLSRPLF